jgi:hypothetical protein
MIESLLTAKELTPAMIVTFIATALALIFEYLPWVSDWYNGLDDNKQKLLMLVMIAVVVFGAFGLSCAGLFAYFACEPMGFWNAVILFIACLSANQGMHRVLPKKSTSWGVQAQRLEV